MFQIICTLNGSQILRNFNKMSMRFEMPKNVKNLAQLTDF